MDISVVIPLYNEAESLPELFSWIERVMKEHNYTYEVIFVNDGSTDNSWEVIEELKQRSPHVRGIKFRRNYGKSPGLHCGFQRAKGDVVITMDADLQDPPALLPQMLDTLLTGEYDCAATRRTTRKGEPPLRSWFARKFYQIINKMSDTEIVDGARDFRLMSRRTLQALMAYPERNLFLRGMVSALGYPSARVYYDRKERMAGESKYPFSKMLSFALDGITSFSVRPLRYISMLGLLFILISLVAIAYGIVVYVEGNTIPGWTSLLVSVWFIGGTILMALGIIGEYVGKIYKEVKRRPRYFVEQTAGMQEPHD